MTEPDPKDLPAVALRLITTIDGLTKAIGELLARAESSEERISASETKVEDTTRRVKSNERRAHAIRILVLFDILATVLGFYLGYTLVATNARLDTVCPLYAFYVGTYAPQTRSAGPDRDAYIRAFADMRIKFIGLGCGPAYPIVPGAAHPPAAAPPPN
jgi:hypothetical protein